MWRVIQSELCLQKNVKVGFEKINIDDAKINHGNEMAGKFNEMFVNVGVATSVSTEMETGQRVLSKI